MKGEATPTSPCHWVQDESREAIDLGNSLQECFFAAFHLDENVGCDTHPRIKPGLYVTKACGTSAVEISIWSQRISPIAPCRQMPLKNRSIIWFSPQ